MLSGSGRRPLYFSSLSSNLWYIGPVLCVVFERGGWKIGENKPSCLVRSSPTSVGFQGFSVVFGEYLSEAPPIMARLRQRMGCRRGQPRRAPNDPTSDLPATSELFTGRYLSTRSGRGRCHISNLPSGPPSSTGSTIFTFNNSLHQPRVTAHISVVFYETTQLEGSDSHMGGSGAADGPPPAF